MSVNLIKLLLTYLKMNERFTFYLFIFCWKRQRHSKRSEYQQFIIKNHQDNFIFQMSFNMIWMSTSHFPLQVTSTWNLYTCHTLFISWETLLVGLTNQLAFLENPIQPQSTTFNWSSPYWWPWKVHEGWTCLPHIFYLTGFSIS